MTTERVRHGRQVPPIAAAVAGALRYVAGLQFAKGDEDGGRDYYGIADDVEREDYADSWCCPLCEELTCDTGCPLAVIRAFGGSSQ